MATIPRALFLVSLLVALSSAAVPAASAGRGSRPIHLHFYMHDITGGPGQTAVQLVKGPGPSHPLMPGAHFGDTTVIDDLLTEGPSAASRAVGRAQGSYMLAGLREPVLMVSMTVALARDGPYNGSTVAVVGRDDVSEGVRELAVAGGTGAFRKATGHVLWRTAKMESRDHMVLELDVYATVPGGASAGDGQRQAS
ncbi:dirigent protein 1 [Brachypodium distachyon]|nr:dirigent protein 1 [Brachypodium distachyon]|eukprot:XP_010234081.3 dirigent protein 1 [Brachypodium distachyon]